jgi:hypothetical protein
VSGRARVVLCVYEFPARIPDIRPEPYFRSTYSRLSYFFIMVGQQESNQGQFSSVLDVRMLIVFIYCLGLCELQVCYSLHVHCSKLTANKDAIKYAVMAGGTIFAVLGFG